LVLAQAAWEFHRDTAANEAADVTQAGELINSARGTLALPVGYALIAFHFLVQIALDLAWLLSGETPPAEWLAEAHAGELSGASATESSEDRAQRLAAATRLGEDP